MKHLIQGDVEKSTEVRCWIQYDIKRHYVSLKDSTVIEKDHLGDWSPEKDDSPCEEDSPCANPFHSCVKIGDQTLFLLSSWSSSQSFWLFPGKPWAQDTSFENAPTWDQCFGCCTIPGEEPEGGEGNLSRYVRDKTIAFSNRSWLFKTAACDTRQAAEFHAKGTFCKHIAFEFKKHIIFHLQVLSHFHNLSWQRSKWQVLVEWSRSSLRETWKIRSNSSKHLRFVFASFFVLTRCFTKQKNDLSRHKLLLSFSLEAHSVFGTVIRKFGTRTMDSTKT